MIQDLLQQLKLSEKEIAIYMAILKQGKTTPARVAKSTGINRSTVYAVAGGLIEKELLREDISSKIQYYSVTPAEDLEDIFYHQQEELKAKKKVAAELAREIEKIPKSRNYSIPRIRFIQEVDLEEFLYKQMGHWNESARTQDGTCWGFQDHSFAQNFKNFINWSWKKFHLQVNLLSNESDIEKRLKNEFDTKRDIQFWSKDLEFTSSTWIMGDYFIMIITRQKPFYLVEIHDSVLAHNMREVFKKIWNDVSSNEK